MDGLISSGRFAPSDLREFASAALIRAGASPDDAALVAEGLVAADLRGVHTHGILRLAVYTDRLRRQSFNPRAPLSVIREEGAAVLLDAANGLGIAMAARAMDLAVERARRSGVAVVGVRNSSHAGMMAYLAMRPLRENMIGIAMSNADAHVAPWGAAARYLGTNPLSIAVPAQEEPDIVLDMATSVVPHARIRAAAARHEQIPLGWGLDSRGRPTADPKEVLAGALLPFGEAKGSGLVLMVDVLAGILTGALSGPMIAPLYDDLDTPQRLGQLLIAVAVSAFTSVDEFTTRIDRLVREVRALPVAEGHDRVFLPGEIEHRRAVEYGQRGIPLPEEIVAEVRRLAAELEIAVPAHLTR